MVVVTAAVIEKNGKVLLARRKAGGPLGGLWEFPGGKLEEGEDPKDCLRRELQEEFGIDTRVGEHIVTNVHSYAHITIELRSFWVRHDVGEIHPTDHDEIAWVAPSELGRYAVAPADLPTVAAIQDKSP